MAWHFGLQSMFYKYDWGFNDKLHTVRETAIQHMELACCRRDSAALQAVVAADEDFLLATGRDTLFWKGGSLAISRIEAEVDPGLTLEVKLIGLIEDDDRSLKSDPILDQDQLFVEKGRIQPVWIECSADAQTVPGAYSGKIRLYVHTLFEDETLAGECSFTVNVKEIVLPEPKDYKFYLDLWQHNSNIARKYQVGLWTEEHFRIIDQYLYSLSQLGQKAVTLIVSEIPWSGQFGHKMRVPSDLFEYSMVRVTRKQDGAFIYDFSVLNRIVAMADKHGIKEEIELFGLLNIWQDEEAGYGALVDGHPDGIRIRYYDEGTKTYRFMRELESLNDYIAALAQHMERQGWTNRVRVLADEPSDFELFERRVEALRGVAPSFLYKVAINHAEFIQRNIRGMTDYVPIIQCAGTEYDRLIAIRNEIPGKLLYYVCCFPDQPNTFIGSPSIESRLIPWLAEKLNLDGFLRWNYTVWTDRPLESMTYRPSVFRTGDLNFVYPGANGKPMLSLRYKWLQRGIRDYELMQLLKEEGQGQQVEAALNRVFRFGHPRELSPEQHKRNDELYSMDVSDYDRLIKDL